MPYEIAELITILLMVFMIGSFILLFPLSRRLGKVMEEWLQLRQDSSPDRDRLERIEDGIRLLHQQSDSLEQRVSLIGERQDFLESLTESRVRDALPASRPEERNGRS